MISCVGTSVDECFAALCGGESGNAPLQAFDATRYRISRAYEIRDRRGSVDASLRASGWLSMAIQQAIESAGLQGTSERIPVLVGTGLRELRSLELWWTAGHEFDVQDLHFRGAVRQAGVRGPTLTVSNACSASLFTLGLGADLLDLGEADTVVIAGADSITESMLGLLDRVHAVPPERIRPFDRHRRGVLLGEGAVAVVLESDGAAERRGRRPLARLRGVGLSSDAHHTTAPDLEGITKAMHDAHRRAAVRPEDVDLVLVHGTGTMLNDETEARALQDVFGAAVTHPLFAGLKSMLGHTSGGSGLMSLVTAIECLRAGRVPPTVGLDDPIREAEGMRFVTGEAREADVRLAQVDAFGFGGVNAVAVVERA
jgi:3-oxoacyl-[acyl-carrier-protein] synthase II